MGKKRKKNHGEVQLAGFEVYLDTKMGERLLGGDFHSCHGKRSFFLKGKRITPNAIGYLKRFSKTFPKENICVESTKDGKPSKTKDQVLDEPKQKYLP